MPERARKKKPRDVNELAAHIPAEATEDHAENLNHYPPPSAFRAA